MHQNQNQRQRGQHKARQHRTQRAAALPLRQALRRDSTRWRATLPPTTRLEVFLSRLGQPGKEATA